MSPPVAAEGAATGDAALGVTSARQDGTSGRHVFRSQRATTRDLPQLFTVAPTGGAPEEVPLPSGYAGSYSADASRIAYTPFQQWQPAWRKYRGGQTTPVWLADLATGHITKVPRPETDSNDRAPMWVGDKVYFLSDRNGPVTLFRYDPATKKVDELLKNNWKDIQYATAGTGGWGDRTGSVFSHRVRAMRFRNRKSTMISRRDLFMRQRGRRAWPPSAPGESGRA